MFAKSIASCVVGLVLLGSSGLRAENNPAADDLYHQAVSLYRDGRFKEAAKAFKEAYVLAGDDVLLLNAARSWEKAGGREAAAKLYAAVHGRKGLPAEIKRRSWVFGRPSRR